MLHHTLKELHLFISKNVFSLSTVSFILCVGVFLRVYHAQNYVFGFDQIQILQKAEEITHGNFTLVGPRTGPADLFTGPLVYYIVAFFLAVSNHSPYALVGLTATCSLVSGLGLYLLSRRTQNNFQAIALLAIWSCAPFFVAFDRIPWNPLFSLLASSMVFFSILRILNSTKVSVPDVLFIFFGSFLGYQAHFSCLILPILVFLCLILFKTKQSWVGVLSLLGLLLSVIPTLIFDLKQNWHNTKGLLSLLHNKDKVERTIDLWRLLKDVQVSFENIGKVFFSQMHISFLILFGLLIFVGASYLLKKDKEVKTKVRVSVLWITFIAMTFSFYREVKPEYYYLVQFPAILILISEVLDAYLVRSVQTVVLCFFCFYGFIHTVSTQYPASHFGLESQYKASQEIKARLLSGQVDSVTYAMTSSQSEGLRYFVGNDYTFNHDSGYDLYIIYPVSSQRKVTQRFGEIGIWADSRNDKEKNYLTFDNYSIKTDKNILLLEDHYSPPIYGGNLVYKILKDGQDTQQLLVIMTKSDNNFDIFEKILNQVLTSPWSTVSVDQYKGKAMFSEVTKQVFILIDEKNSQKVSSSELVIEQ